MIKKYRISDAIIGFSLPYDIADDEYTEKFRTDIEEDCDILYEVLLDYKYNNDRIKDTIELSHGCKLYRYMNNDNKFTYYNIKRAESSFLIEFENDRRIFSISGNETDEYNTMGRIFRRINIDRALLEKEILILHSNYIIHNGHAILFTGMSGAGKSTQGNLWHKYKGAEVINGDKTAIKLLDSSLYAYGVPFAGTSNICINKKAEVKAIVLVNKADMNEVEELDEKQAFKVLLGQIAISRWDRAETEKVIDMIGHIINYVKVVKLNCQANNTATDVLNDYLFKGV